MISLFIAIPGKLLRINARRPPKIDPAHFLRLDAGIDFQRRHVQRAAGVVEAATLDTAVISTTSKDTTLILSITSLPIMKIK